MTFQDILDMARTRLRHTREAFLPTQDDDPVAIWIVDKLGEDRPCGLAPPTGSNGLVMYENDEYTPSEARWLAAALLRAADEAETK
jgi:hypothetical protein